MNTEIKEVVIKKRLFDSPWGVADVICKLDRNDPHFELKVANLIKGYGHAIHADEVGAAPMRTHDCKTRADFLDFFQDRFEKHSGAAANWFSPETDGFKLKHRYGELIEGEVVGECTSDPKEPCTCWFISTKILEEK